MTDEELVARHPRLWHMAEDGSWPSIRKHGLLSTAALLDLYGVTGERRVRLLRQRRPQSVTIEAAGLGRAVVRDQKPMHDGGLVKCLVDGLAPSDWYAILNAKTFFWVEYGRLEKLLAARAYRSKAQTVITLDTASLLAAHRERVTLCSINSGATLYVPQERGLSTFLPIADFRYAKRRVRHPAAGPPVELVVEAGVPDVVRHVLAVDRHAGGVVTPVWRPGP